MARSDPIVVVVVVVVVVVFVVVVVVVVVVVPPWGHLPEFILPVCHFWQVIL